MNDKGNERALFFTTVTELTGEAEHERLTELEVIFGQYEDIDAHALRRCANLHKLTFINCRLQRIPTLALHAVRESLVHLCLCAQNISIIEPLDLPNLRALYLQQNHIKRIEGLDACRRLQVLWLYGNRIGRIEGLGQSTDLRELWLQDNVIQSLLSNENDSALDALVNLESLCLAKNRIRNIDDLQTLRKLINLRSLSLVDEHFGSNPIVRHPEYRAVAIASLHQLQTLDGTGIEETERTMAVDQFLHQALAFNDTVADLTLSYEHELRAIQTRKERGQSNAEMMQRELVEALNGVEQLVVRGTVELDEERQRQTRLREEHTSITVEALAKLQHQYHQSLDRMLEDELRALDDEDLYYQVLEQEAAAEHNLALTIATVVCTSPERIAAEHLSEHGADFQHIAAHLDPAGEGGVGQTYRLLQVHRFHHTDLVRRFESYSSCDQASLVMNKNQHQGEGLMMHLYCIASENDLSGVLQHGFVGHSEGSASEWLVLFSSPLQALQFSNGALGSLKKMIEGADVDDSEPTARIRSHVLLLCQVLMTHVSPVTIDDSTMSHVGSLQYIVSLATAATSNPAQERRQQFYHVTMGHDKYEGDIYIANRARDLPNVLPQFVMLCSQRLVETKVLSELGDHSNQPEALLESFSRHVNEEIASHHDRLWREMDPERWVRKTQLSSESERLDRDISFEKERVVEEKRSQKSSSSEMEKPHVLRLALSDALLDDPSAASPVHTRTTDSESLVYHRVRRQVVQHGLARVYHHGNASTKESHHRARITRLERQLAIVEKYRQEKARQDARPQVAGDTTDVRNASSSASTVVAEHPASQFPRKIGLRQLTPSPSDLQAKNQQEEYPEHSENNSTSCPTALGMERFAVLASQSTSLKSDSASRHTVALASSVNQSSTPSKNGKAPSRAHFDKSTAHVLCELKITKDIMMREYYVQQIRDEAASLSQLATDLHDMVQRKAKQESLNSASSGLASRRHSYAIPAMTPGSSFTKQPQESGERTSTVLSDPTRCDAEIPEWEARNSDLVYKSHHRITQLHRLVESLQTTTIGLVESILEWRAYKSKPSTMSNIEKHHRFGWKKRNIANYLAHIDSDLRDLFLSPITSILLGANAKYNPLLLPRAALDALGIPEDTFESTTFLTDRQDRSHSVSSEGATTCQLPSPTKRQAYAALHNAVRTVTATLNASPSQFDAGQLRNCLYAIHRESELERNAIDSQITEKLRVATAYNPFESIKLAGGVEDAIANALSQQPEAESVKRAKQLRRRQEDTSRAKQHPCDKGNQGEEVSNHATPLFVNPGRMRRLIEQRKDVREAATDCELRDTTASWQKNKLHGQVMVRRMNIRRIENQHARTIQQQFLVYRRRTQLLRNLAHFVATSRQRVVSIQRLVRGFIAKTRYKEALLRHEERHQRRLAARTIWYAYKRYKRRQRHQRHPHIMSVETIAEIQLIHVLQHQLGDSVVNETSSAERYRKAGEERRRQRAVYLSKRRQELLELETKRTAAAVCIQSIYRMQLARKLAVTIRGERRAHLSAVSAIMIQSKIRGFLKHQEKRRQRFRNDMERVNRSAVRIQSIYRGYNSRTGLIDELSTLAQDGCSKLLEEEEDEEEDNDSEGRSCSENDETLDPGYTILPPIGKSRPSTDSSSHGLTSRSDLHFEEGQDENWSATSIRVSVSSIQNVSLPPIRPRVQSVIQPRSNSVQRTMRQPPSARRPQPSEMMKVELKLKETTLGDDLDLSAANGHKRGSYMGPRRRLSTTPTGSPRWGSSDADGANDCRGSVQGKVLSQLEITNRGWKQVGKNEGS